MVLYLGVAAMDHGRAREGAEQSPIASAQSWST